MTGKKCAYFSMISKEQKRSGTMGDRVSHTAERTASRETVFADDIDHQE